MIEKQNNQVVIGSNQLDFWAYLAQALMWFSVIFYQAPNKYVWLNLASCITISEWKWLQKVQNFLWKIRQKHKVIRQCT